MTTKLSTLQNGVEVVTRVTYTPTESQGPLALAVTAGVSLCAVVAILVAMAISGFKTRHQFIRSQVGAYFLSLVLSDLLQATGSVMNAKWVVIQGVSAGPFCTAQAALKQTGNVGTALWSLVIAIHTFCLLFLRMRIGDRVFYSILVGTWLFMAFIIMLGPLIVHKSERGDFWGISLYWCWITDGYHVEQLTLEYLFMFLAAGTSIVLYSLIFFRLRGNLQGFGWNLKFRRVKQPWVVDDDDDESQMSIAGKQMLWYPVAYTIIIVPIALCRWGIIFGHSVPYWAAMTADAIFLLSGFVNAILYSTTRKIVSIRSLLPFSHLIRIGPACGKRAQDLTASKPYLDDIQFASPGTSSAGEKFAAYQASANPGAPWRSQSDTFTVYTPEEQAVGGQGMSKIYNVVEYPLPGRVSAEIKTRQQDTSVPALPSPPPKKNSPGPVDESTLPQPQPKAMPAAPDMARSASERSVTTDGAPSLHHKRFSGWSLPSVRDANSLRSLEGQESTHTELEEMQFAAPPSPEPVRKNRPPVLSPRSHST